MNGFAAALQKYATFTGRSKRAEYWYFMLFYVLILLVLAIIDGIAGFYSAEAGIGVFSGLAMVGMLIPLIAVSVRRLHDTGRGGWWYLLVLVPVIGAIVLVIFAVQASQPDDNAFGPNPNDIRP